MLNIIMNVPGLELGSNLEALKTLTANLNPAMRGHEVSNNKFLREIHNSFTRLTEIPDVTSKGLLTSNLQTNGYAKF